MKKFLRRLSSAVLNILLTISAIIFVILLIGYIQVRAFDKEYPSMIGYTAFQVASGSMLNTIHVDDIVIVNLKNEKDIFNEQDIIVFKQDDNIITHRIVKIDSNGEITTKGDANNTEDEPITEDKIIGKVVKIIPNIAIWKRVLTSPEILFLIILTIIIWGIGIMMISKDEKE